MKLKVLIADDEEEIVRLYEDSLEIHFDTMIFTVNNGLDAYKLLQKRKFDLIITDHKMPKMTGNGLIQALNSETEKNRDTPVLLVSAFPDLAKENLDDYKNVMFIEKPIRENVLIRKVVMLTGFHIKNKAA